MRFLRHFPGLYEFNVGDLSAGAEHSKGFAAVFEADGQTEALRSHVM